MYICEHVIICLRAYLNQRSHADSCGDILCLWFIGYVTRFLIVIITLLLLLCLILRTVGRVTLLVIAVITFLLQNSSCMHHHNLPSQLHSPLHRTQSPPPAQSYQYTSGQLLPQPQKFVLLASSSSELGFSFC